MHTVVAFNECQFPFTSSGLGFPTFRVTSSLNFPFNIFPKLFVQHLWFSTGHLLVVLEIAENGSLIEFLKKSRQTDQSFENVNSGLTEQMKTSIATDVARGMAHLAKCKVRCVFM